MASTRARMMASGVRSSCAMSAVNSRWAWNPASRRSNARFTAWTSGTISRGIACSGRRTSVRAGPIAAAVVEASRTGSSARRKIRMSISSSTIRIGKVIHATRGKNEATMSSMMTSRCDRSWPIWISTIEFADRLGHADTEQHGTAAATAHEPVGDAGASSGNSSPPSGREENRTRPLASRIA